MRMSRVQNYEEPIVEIFQVEVEQGFAVSDLDNQGSYVGGELPQIQDGGNISWD